MKRIYQGEHEMTTYQDNQENLDCIQLCSVVILQATHRGTTL